MDRLYVLEDSAVLDTGTDKIWSFSTGVVWTSIARRQQCAESMSSSPMFYVMVKLVSLTFMPWSSADRRVCAHDRSRYPNRLLSTSAKPSVTYPNCWHLRIHLSDVHIPPSARTWAKSEVRGEYDHVETFPSFWRLITSNSIALHMCYGTSNVEPRKPSIVSGGSKF